jgi:nucleotide-binding universal stress UspA family protein
MKNILIALDFNPSAQIVAEAGYDIAKDLNAKVTLVHVKAEATYYNLPEHVTVIGFSDHQKDNEPMPPEIINPEIISQEFLKKAKLHLGNNTINTIVVSGSCAETLLNTAQNLQTDLIIMGSHSQKWFENTAMGSVTEKVLLNSTIPVLIIPTKKSY